MKYSYVLQEMNLKTMPAERNQLPRATYIIWHIYYDSIYMQCPE